MDGLRWKMPELRWRREGLTSGEGALDQPPHRISTFTKRPACPEPAALTHPSAAVRGAVRHLDAGAAGDEQAPARDGLDVLLLRAVVRHREAVVEPLAGGHEALLHALGATRRGAGSLGRPRAVGRRGAQERRDRTEYGLERTTTGKTGKDKGGARWASIGSLRRRMRPTPVRRNISRKGKRTLRPNDPMVAGESAGGGDSSVAMCVGVGVGGVSGLCALVLS